MCVTAGFVCSFVRMYCEGGKTADDRRIYSILLMRLQCVISSLSVFYHGNFVFLTLICIHLDMQCYETIVQIRTALEKYFVLWRSVPLPMITTLLSEDFNKVQIILFIHYVKLVVIPIKNLNRPLFNLQFKTNYFLL